LYVGNAIGGHLYFNLSSFPSNMLEYMYRAPASYFSGPEFESCTGATNYSK